jgi:hypothetical protein
MSGSGTGAMMCASCGRPASTPVWIGGMGYHEECTHGPGYLRPTYAPYAVPVQSGWTTTPSMLTAEDVRKIVREELAAARAALNPKEPT